ncbi:MAG: DUF1643 domain-containing protein [Planctomycetota bacterium]|nr:MAG: DUF1643 domain-containing protein [Planctomycetota bacterium]
MLGRASFDRTGQYRYTLSRRWSQGPRRACFCLLNPSTADARRNDPTVRRCIGFAQEWGFDALEVVNIFALRATDPRELARHPAPIGPGNDRAIRRAAHRADFVVLGWGAHGSRFDRGRQVAQMLQIHCQLHCLGLTAEGHPKHPLYLPRSTQPIPFPHTSLASDAVWV